MTEIPERLVPGSPSWDRYYYEHRQRYEFFASLVVGKQVLDAACGVGYGSQILALAGAEWVTGVDISADAISIAKAWFGEGNISFQQMDVMALDLPGESIDVVISFETIEHVASPENFIKEIKRVLRPGGLLVISSPNRDFNGKGEQKNPYHISEMSLNEFEKAIARHFSIKSRYYQSHSESFLRHQLLMAELSKLNKAVRFSWLMRIENKVRKWMGRETWNTELPAAELGNFIPGDMEIRELTGASPRILTYILVAENE